MKEKYFKSPLGKYRIRKESDCIRKCLGLIVLGEVKGLNIHYKDDMYLVGEKQCNLSLVILSSQPMSSCLPNPSQPGRLAIFCTVVILLWI